MINNLAVNSNENTVSWSFKEDEIKLLIPNIGHAICDEKNNTIVISVIDKKFPILIKVFDFKGIQLMSLTEPDTFEFYYIKKHPKLGVSIVCTTEQRIDGRTDWQFGIDYETKSLFRYCPSH